MLNLSRPAPIRSMCRPRVSIPPLAFEVVGQPGRSKGLLLRRGDTRAQNTPTNPKDTLRPIVSHAHPRSGPARFTRSHRATRCQPEAHATRTTRDMRGLERSQGVQGVADV